MRKFPKSLVVTTVVVFATGVQANGQDIVQTQHTLRDAQQKLGRIKLLLSSHGKDSPALTDVNTKVGAVRRDIERARDRLALIEQDLLRNVASGFEGLTSCEVTWKVALRHKAFLDVRPNDVAISIHPGTTIIDKTGNPPGGPIAPSPAYHVCPSVELEADDRAVVRFSIPRTSSRGGTPVPYFGLRDADGNELVLGGLIDDSKEHEIRIQCHGADSFAFYDGKLQARNGQHGKLTSPLLLFFQMNDNSQLKVSDIRFSNARPPSLKESE